MNFRVVAEIRAMADPGHANGVILNLKLSNSSHSERHFCRLATYCTSKKHCFWPPTGGGACLPRRPPGSATTFEALQFRLN